MTAEEGAASTCLGQTAEALSVTAQECGFTWWAMENT